MVINGNDDTLLRSCRIGNTVEALLALKSGADVHFNDDEALYSASWRGLTSMVRLLLERGADATSRESGAAIQAASFEHREIVEMLVKHGASDDALCVLELVEQGFNLSGKAALGLIGSARFGLLRETRVLLEHSHNSFDRDTVIWALALAERGNHREIVALLSEYSDREDERTFEKRVQSAKQFSRSKRRIIDQVKIFLIESALKCGLDDNTASKRIGVSKRTFRAWKAIWLTGDQLSECSTHAPMT